MTREEAVTIVNEKQYEFPVENLHEFREFHMATEADFWEIHKKMEKPGHLAHAKRTVAAENGARLARGFLSSE